MVGVMEEECLCGRVVHVAKESGAVMRNAVRQDLPSLNLLYFLSLQASLSLFFSLNYTFHP